MNDCGSDRWMGICEPSLALSIASGSQTDALVSDCSSKANPSTGQEACCIAPPVEVSSLRRSIQCLQGSPLPDRNQNGTSGGLLCRGSRRNGTQPFRFICYVGDRHRVVIPTVCVQFAVHGRRGHPGHAISRIPIYLAAQVVGILILPAFQGLAKFSTLWTILGKQFPDRRRAKKQ